MNNRLRQELNINSPALDKIAKHMAKDGFTISLAVSKQNQTGKKKVNNKTIWLIGAVLWGAVGYFAYVNRWFA